MKRILIFSIILFLSFNIFSQEILEIKGYLGFKSVITRKIINISADKYDLDKLGKQIWDFSKIKSNEQTQIYFSEPQNTPYSKHFPKANYCFFYKTKDYSQYIYQYIDKDKFYKIGDVLVYNSYTVIKKELLFFPELSNITTNSDTASIIHKSTTQIYTSDKTDDKIIFKTNTKMQSICNSYGKVKLPNETYKNAFLLKYTGKKIDSMFINDEFVEVTKSPINTYYWYSVDKNGSLINIIYVSKLYDNLFFQYTDKIQINGQFHGEMKIEETE